MHSPRIFRGGRCGAALRLALLALLAAAPPVAQAARIHNVAVATYQVGPERDGERQPSNDVELNSIPGSSPGVVTFYQYAPPAGTISLPADGGSCADASGAFSPLPAPVLLDGSLLPLSGALPLIDARAFHAGEPIVVGLVDLNRNLDPGQRELAQVQLHTDDGDEEWLLLQETGPDTGRFAGVIQSVPMPPAPTRFDCRLSVAQPTQILADYQDPYYPSDTSHDMALVDPFGVVFDSSTGAPVSGATVTMIDAATGLPARVFGDDGRSSFPASLITGGSAADSNGRSYAFPPGGFRFPYVPPGRYRLRVEPPQGFNAPSTVPLETLLTVRSPAGDLYAVVQGSRGEEFAVAPGPALNIDFPVDPLNSTLALQKAASHAEASAGDFVQFRLTLSNRSASNPAAGVAVTDTLPAQLRYVPGSLTVGGNRAADPVLSADGRTLTIVVGSLAAGASVEIAYVVQVGAAALEDAIAVNHAAAQGDDGIVSNPAEAAVHLRPSLLSRRFTLIGRVVEGDCATPWDGLAAVAGARLLLDDGTYVASDADGMFHFEGVRPGTHVVQLDLDSLPPDLEPVPCIQNSRFAGRAFSQFVEAQGGTLWRSDFYLKRKPPVEGVVGIRLSGERADPPGTVRYRIDLDGGAVPVDKLRAMAMLPAEARYQPGSTQVDGQPAPDPQISGNVAVFGLGRPGAGWTRRIEFSARLAPVAPLADDAPQLLTLASGFDTRKATLNADGDAALEALIAQIRPGPLDLVEVTGHTDAVRIAPANRREFADNDALSQARARSVAGILAQRLGLRPGQLRIQGYGAAHPLAANASAAGRAKNRRVEIVVHHAPGAGAPSAPTSGQAARAVATFDGPQGNALTTPAVAWAPAAAGEPAAASERGVQAVQATVSALRAAGAPPPPVEVMDDVTAAGGGIDWLARAGHGNAWIYPPADHNPRAPSLRVVIQHEAGLTVVLRRDGAEVPVLAFDGDNLSADQSMGVSVWRGLELAEGDNRFTADLVDASGKTVATLTRSVHYANVPVAAELVPEQSSLVADGLARPVVAVRFLDRAHRPVRAGVTGPLVIATGQVPAQLEQFQQQRALAGMDRFTPTYRVEGDDGIARIELQPTTDSGALSLEFMFENGRHQELRTWLQPAGRDWVVVGFAAGTVGYDTLSSHAEPLAGRDDGLHEDGQVSLYAKGRVRGQWLLTLAYDTDKPAERERRERLLAVIDPHEFYTLYGDRAGQRYDAASQAKLYLKLERDQFYALFGDYETGLDETRLSRYSRTMNGIKSEYQGERFSYRAFAADTPQNYARDEIQGNGTSGLYRLGRSGIVINSDKLRLETRDRFRSELIVRSRPLLRHLDYDIDYGAGTLLFREPVASRDFDFNPVFIVAEYETTGGASTALNAGGRAAVRLAGGRVQLGATVIRDANSQGHTDLTGADLRVKLGADTELRLEAASSRGQAAAVDREGSAYLAEVEHHAGPLDALAYARRQEAGFGVGQQNGVESATTKTGVDAKLHLGAELSLQGQAYRQESAASDVRRDVAAVHLQYRGSAGGVSAGVQVASDHAPGGTSFDSRQVSLAANRFFFDKKLELSGQADVGVDGRSESVDFPTRYTFGAAYALTEETRLIVAEEFTEGPAFDSTTTRAGFEVKPWQGARLNTTLNQSQIREYGPRTFAEMGLTQGLLLGERWSVDFGVDSSRSFHQSASPPPVASPGQPFASGGVLGQGSLTEDFVAFSAGATYRAPSWSWNGRAELRNGEHSRRQGLISGFLRQAAGGIALSASGQMFRVEQNLGPSALTASLDFGLAVRPTASRYALLDRLELRYDELLDGTGAPGPTSTLAVSGNARSRRIINNVSLNGVSRQWQAHDAHGNPFVLDQRNQWSLYYGSKYAFDDFQGADYRGYTDLIGVEWRFDLTPRWDLGLQASQLHVWNAHQYSYAIGPSLGFTPVANGWVSLGYNLAGFRDRDFEAARYTEQGPYLKLRFKFDQATFGGDGEEPDTAAGGTR